MAASWADATDDDTVSSLFIHKLIERMDDILDDMNKDICATDQELEWIKYDVKMWLGWKLCPEASKDNLTKA
jgi:hypothetical protein